MTYHRDIEDVVEAMRNAKLRGKSCALLIGAGCSVRAGIPLAGEFVEIIRNRWPSAYARAQNKIYPDCMAELSAGERRDLIKEYVDSAKINWASIAIAQLIKSGFADRVLTTNFDPLVLRACSLVNITPGIYDFAASQQFKPAFTSENAIFHLHGQHTGFVLLNTKAEVDRLASAVAPLFEDAGRNRLWLVAGYSGDNDPVFEQLAKVENFDQRLYWIGFKNNEPSKAVRERLLSKEKSAFLVSGYDADDFFVMLAQKLGCFPPQWIEKPFTYLFNVLDSLVSFELPGESTALDITATTRAMLNSAIARFEDGDEGKVLRAEQLMLAGQYDSVINIGVAGAPSQLIDLLAWAHTMQGTALSAQAKGKSGAEADALFDKAGEKYAAALDIKPGMHEALNNWGTVLSAQAKGKSGAEADALFDKAGEKYAAALGIKPDKYEALNNWGIALSDQAKGKSGAEADALFDKAGEKYAAALGIKPDMHEALNNWGNALSAQAKGKSGAEADALFDKAGEKYAAALGIKPDMHEALNNWGAALSDQAKGKSGAEADALFDKAGEKCAAALGIKPDMHEALNNWGAALSDQAKRKSGAEADALFDKAGEKYAAAIGIKPDMHEALNNWGAALSDQAKGKSGAEADALLDKAGEKYAAALGIKPGMHEALNNWGNALSAQAKGKSGAEADALFDKGGRSTTPPSASSPTSTKPSTTGELRSRPKPRGKAAPRLTRCSTRRGGCSIALKFWNPTRLYTTLLAITRYREILTSVGII